MSEQKIPIPAMLYNAAVGGHVTNSQQIIDENENKEQSQINAEVKETLGSGGSVDTRIEAAVNIEKSRAQAAEADRYTKGETYNKEEVNNLITTPNQQYVSVTATDQTTAATDVLPTTGAANTVYRVGNWDGSAYDDTVYSEYAWNGTAYVFLRKKDYGIDDEPIIGSDNLVKSGGVENCIFDLTGSIHLPETNFINGYFYSPVDGNIVKVDNTSFYTSAPIKIKKDDSLYFWSNVPSDRPALAIVVFDSSMNIVKGIRGTCASWASVPTPVSYICENNGYVVCTYSNEMNPDLYNVTIKRNAGFSKQHLNQNFRFFLNDFNYNSDKIVFNKNVLIRNFSNHSYDTSFDLSSIISTYPYDDATIEGNNIIINTESWGNGYVWMLAYNEDDNSFVYVKNGAFNIPSKYFLAFAFVKNQDGSTYCIGHESEKYNALLLKSKFDNIINRNVDKFTAIYGAKKHYDESHKSYWYQTDSNSKLFCIAHSTDIHTDTIRMKNFNDFVDGVPEIDLAICTGDFTIQATDSEFSVCSLVPSTKSILKVVGNHDVLSNTRSLAATKTIMGISEDNLYYYKDYSNKKVRIIVLNQYDVDSNIVVSSGEVRTIRQRTAHYSQNQIDWLINALDDAISNDYNVIVCMHTPEGQMPPRSNDKKFYQRNQNWREHTNICSGPIIEDIINAFKHGSTINATYSYSDTEVNIPSVSVNHTFASDGKFVCYIAGHLHSDFIGYSTNYEDQLYLIETCTCAIPQIYLDTNYGEEVNDLPRIPGTVSEDAFNIYCFDFDKKHIKVVRIGSNVNDLMEDRDKDIYDY